MRGRPENLRRGAVGPPPPGTSIGEQLERKRREEERIDQAARTSPEDVIEALFAEAAKFTIARLRKMNRMKGEIPRSDIEVVRETRQLADRAYEIQQARGHRAEADEFFAALDARLAAVEAVLSRLARPFVPPGEAAGRPVRPGAVLDDAG